MIRLKTKILALTSLLSVIVPGVVTPSESTQDLNNPPTIETKMKFSGGAGPTQKSIPPKPHHVKKRKTQDSAAIKKSVEQAGGTAPRTGETDVKYAPPGIVDVLKGNDAGKQNTGSPDHVPGTTGTSGQ